MTTTNHPNRRPFSGILTRVDEASDKAPHGARGHRVILTRVAALEALHTLIGMAVDFADNFDGHNAQQKCGVIDRAYLNGNDLCVSGYIFQKDFPNLADRIHPLMGMSYEIAGANVEDFKAKVWVVYKATFTGAAILHREKAAYRQTRFSIDRENVYASRTSQLGLCAVRPRCV